MADREATEPVIIPLDASCPVEDFDCGEPARNTWLCTRAFGNQGSDDTRTYVAVRDGRVVGFYAIATGSIIHAGLPGAARRNAPDPISAMLLAQLGVAVDCQRLGIGRDLILHAMQQTVKVADIAGCRLFAVHPARDDLVGYYRRFEFVLADTVPPVMVMPMKLVRKILADVARPRP